MMSYGDQRPKSFQGEKFAKIMSHANISKVKLSKIETLNYKSLFAIHHLKYATLSKSETESAQSLSLMEE
jgi:hypothetical protein